MVAKRITLRINLDRFHYIIQLVIGPAFWHKNLIIRHPIRLLGGKRPRSTLNGVSRYGARTLQPLMESRCVYMKTIFSVRVRVWADFLTSYFNRPVAHAACSFLF